MAGADFLRTLRWASGAAAHRVRRNGSAIGGARSQSYADASESLDLLSGIKASPNTIKRLVGVVGPDMAAWAHDREPATVHPERDIAVGLEMDMTGVRMLKKYLQDVKGEVNDATESFASLRHKLKRYGVNCVIRHFACMEASRGKLKGINKRLQYFRTHQARMQYHKYRREGQSGREKWRAPASRSSSSARTSQASAGRLMARSRSCGYAPSSKMDCTTSTGMPAGVATRGKSPLESQDHVTFLTHTHAFSTATLARILPLNDSLRLSPRLLAASFNSGGGQKCGPLRAGLSSRFRQKGR